MQRVFFISSLVFAVAFAQSPNCKPTEGVDFTKVPIGHCPNIIQYLNGDPGSPYAFDFNWCNTAASSSCAPSYVVQGGGGVCDRPFTGWTSGMSWNAQYQQVSYTVNDGAGTTATVTLTCDPNGADNTITCLSQYQVVGPNPSYQYTISLTSKCACPGGCSGGGGGDVPSLVNSSCYPKTNYIDKAPCEIKTAAYQCLVKSVKVLGRTVLPPPCPTQAACSDGEYCPIYPLSAPDMPHFQCPKGGY